MQPITHAASQWRQLCDTLGRDPQQHSAERKNRSNGHSLANLGEGYDKGQVREDRQAGWAEYQQTAGGRNKRDVWQIATQPQPLAHFATYPEELVRTCIKAGTSEYGACPTCGAPWVRVVEKPHIRGNNRTGTERNHNHFLALPPNGAGNNPGVTTGWRLSCTCPPAEPVPCTVLDPFAGSGTTLKVAIDLGRDAIGVELSSVYIETIIKPRMRDVLPLLQAGGD